MIRVVLIILLLQSIESQPRCTTSGIPALLPVLNSQSVVLDTSRYLLGPNLTLSLNTTSPLVTLTSKYNIQQQKHNLNTILEIASANGIISMLGVSSVSRFYIYYAPVTDPNRLSVKQIPASLERCSNHALSPDATSIAITCENANRTKFIVALSKLNEDDDWEIYLTPKYVASSTRETQYLTNRHLAVVVTHMYNSYIQVWDTQYGRIVGIFDRTFFGLKYLHIVDIQLTAGSLFILDYETGIYELRFDFNTFHIVRQLQFTYYSKMAVHVNSIVVSKKGSITEFAGKSTFKYEAAVFETINELIISDEYIIVYTSSQVIAYLRGYHTPYFTIPTSNYLISGVFLTDSKIVQTVSLYHTTQLSIQSLTLSHPYIKIPKDTLNQTEVVVSAVSRLNDLEFRCKLNFTVIRTDQKMMEIFDSELNRTGTQHIYMNRPGRAEIDLTGYGMGPNLHYEIQKFAETVNVTAEIRKLKSIDTVEIQGIDKIKVKGTYFSDTCGQFRNECPLAIDTNTLGMIRFYQCNIQADTYNMAKRINCSERYKQFKVSEYVHYQLEQSPNELDFFYEISVLSSAQNQISIRKFKITSQFYSPILSAKIKIEGENTYGQHNIKQLEFDEENRLVFALMPMKKQIQVFKIMQNSQEIQYKSIMKINSEAISGKYFAPSRFSLDSDGGLWVKSIDQMIVFDFRLIDILDKPIILSTVQISLLDVKNYDYDFQIVEQTKASQLFTPTPDVSANTGNQQRNRKYLVLSNLNNTLLVCPVSHLYEIDIKQMQPLPRYENNVPQEKSQRIVQSLGNSQVFVSLNGFGQTKVNMIYNLGSLSLASSYYTSIQTNKQAMPAYFYLSSSNPLVLFLETVANSSVAKAFQICDKPKVLLTVSEMLGEKQNQQLILKVFNQKLQIRHSILLGISNSPEVMVKGSKYPYPNIKAYAQDIYIQTDTLGWVSGNVLNISYACTHCEKPTNDDDAYIDVKGKLWVKSEMTIGGGHDFQVITNRGNEAAIMRNNMIYILDSSTNRIQGLHQLTQTSTDSIIQFKINWQHRLIAASIRNQINQISIVIYTITNFKGFTSSRMQLPSSVNYVLSMDYKENVIIVLDFDNLYIIGVDSFANTYLVDYINQVQAGGSVCWAELLDPVDDIYSLILTLCDSGITYISFKLEQNYSVLTILNKQTLDLKDSLNSINIRMPTDSSFLRTLTTRTNNSTQLNLMVIIYKFNSFEWTLTLRNKVIISQAKVNRIIHRYGDFGATNDVSYDETHRFMVLTYFGFLQNKYQYFHAIYDTEDVHMGSQDQPYKNCYIMQTLQTQMNKRPQFAKNRTLLVLSDDANHLKTIDVHNKFRAIVHNHEKLQSQSLFMIPYSPVSSINIEIFVKGIDVVVWEIWEILLIVLLCVIFLSILAYLLKIFFTKYQQNKKLVPLLVDYAEYEQDLAQEIQQKKRNSMSLSDKSKDSQKNGKKQALQQMGDSDEEEDDKKIGNINVSERGSVNV